MPASRLVPDDSWPSLGWGVIDWVETYLCHGPGDVAGEPIELDDEFALFLIDAYRLYPKGHDKAGLRVVTDCELSRAKGRAKSELAGMLVCSEFLGPVRFDHWDDNGEPVGKAVTYPFIRCLATEETQAGNSYDNVMMMLQHGLEHHPTVFAGVDVGRTRTYLTTGAGGEIRPSTASSSSKDGGKESFVVADETHLYTLPELRQMFRMVSRNLRKRRDAQPWILSTTTQFQPGQDSVAEGNREEAEAQLAGKRPRRSSFMWDHREGFEVEDWDDDDEVMASLKEAYGAATHMPLESILIDEIRHHGSTRADACRYWLNQRHAGDGKAIDPIQWDAMSDPLRHVADNARVVLGFDGSKTGDSTALVAWDVDGERPHLFVLGVWERPRGASSDWHVPRDQVDGAVTAAFDRYNVLQLWCDPPGWRDEISRWIADFGDDRVLAFDTNQPKRMGAAVERFCDEAVPNGSFTHDGDLVLRRHAANAVRGLTRGGFAGIYKEKDTLKIDALVASVLAYQFVLLAPPPEPDVAPMAMWID